MSDRIHELFEKQAEGQITELEIIELRNLCKKDFVELDEFTIAKIAFQRGYIKVYRDDISKSKNKNSDIATPDNWIIDSTVINEFCSDLEEVFKVETSSGDFFYLSKEARDEFKREIEVSEIFSVNNLLEAYRRNNLKNIMED